jgi:hypothetical protein
MTLRLLKSSIAGTTTLSRGKVARSASARAAST